MHLRHTYSSQTYKITKLLTYADDITITAANRHQTKSTYTTITTSALWPSQTIPYSTRTSLIIPQNITPDSFADQQHYTSHAHTHPIILDLTLVSKIAYNKHIDIRQPKHPKPYPCSKSSHRMRLTHGDITLTMQSYNKNNTCVLAVHTLAFNIYKTKHKYYHYTHNCNYRHHKSNKTSHRPTPLSYKTYKPKQKKQTAFNNYKYTTHIKTHKTSKLHTPNKRIHI